MLYLKCTAQVQSIIGLTSSQLSQAEPSVAPLGNWYINRFPLRRRKAFVFMSETTLLSFVLLQGKKPVTVETLPLMLLAGLERLLTMRGLPADAVERALAHYDTGAFSKTGNRSDLGSLNDLVFPDQHIVHHRGGLDQSDLTDIIMRINETPQQRLGWCNSWEVTESKLLDLH